MVRKTLDELAKLLDEAQQKIEVGGQYMHYKQLHYIVKDLVIWEETDEVAVIYQAEYDSRLTFARPLTVWLETVEVNGQTVSRFIKVANK